MRKAVALALGAAPALASACAACARDSSPGAWLLVAALIAAPYAVALVAIGAIRRAQRGEP
jgi:hypothetical protein